MSSKRRRTASLLLILVGVLVLAFIFGARNEEGRPVTVTTTQAVRQNLSSWISTNGKVEPIEPYVIQSQLTTFIKTVSVKEGQMVARGQVLLTLDTMDLVSEIARAREQLVSAEDERNTALSGGSPAEIAQLDSDLAKSNLEIERLQQESESLQRLYAKQAATRQEVDQNNLALEKAKADKQLTMEKRQALAERSKVQAERAKLRMDEAADALRSLEEKLSAANVVAPVSGTVYILPARTGTYVHTGDLLAEMADLRRIRVRAFVDEPDLGSLQEGQHVEITWDALPNRVWTGQVDQLPKTIVARGSRSVGEVLCSIHNENNELLPNTNVDARILTNQRENALVISRAAILTEDSRHYVFVVDQGRLRRQEVTLGISNATDYQVLGGITEKDVIALPGGSELRDGTAVTIAQQ